MTYVPTGGVLLEKTLETVLQPGAARAISGPASPGAGRRKPGARHVLKAAKLIGGFQMVLMALPALNAGHRRVLPAAAAQGYVVRITVLGRRAKWVTKQMEILTQSLVGRPLVLQVPSRSLPQMEILTQSLVSRPLVLQVPSRSLTQIKILNQPVVLLVSLAIAPTEIALNSISAFPVLPLH
jgi:hypothetical protein